MLLKEAIVPDPDIINDIVNHIDENKKQFEIDVESPSQIKEDIEGIEVKNVEVKSGKNTINAKVLRENGVTLCIILQKTFKVFSQIVKLVLVNSIRLNLLQMNNITQERIKNKSSQLSSEEYEKIKLYANTSDIDIEGIKSIKNKKEAPDLVEELDNLIKALEDLLKNNGTVSTEPTVSSSQQQNLKILEEQLKNATNDDEREELENKMKEDKKIKEESHKKN